MCARFFIRLVRAVVSEVTHQSVGDISSILMTMEHFYRYHSFATSVVCSPCLPIQHTPISIPIDSATAIRITRQEVVNDVTIRAFYQIKMCIDQCV